MPNDFRAGRLARDRETRPLRAVGLSKAASLPIGPSKETLDRAPTGSSTSTGTRPTGGTGRSAIFMLTTAAISGPTTRLPTWGSEARLCVSEAVDAISVALRSGSDQFVVRIPVGRRGSIELLRNNQRKTLTELLESV